MSLSGINLELPSAQLFEDLLAPLYNGEIGILALDDAGDDTDEQGYPIANFTQLNAARFIPCVWVGKKIDERLVAEQTRALAGYEISVTQSLNGEDIRVNAQARLAIKFRRGAPDFQILEVLAVVNQQNLFWHIYAVNINE